MNVPNRGQLKPRSTKGQAANQKTMVATDTRADRSSVFQKSRLSSEPQLVWFTPFDFMKADIHPRYEDAEIRCACGNVIKTRSTKQTIIIGICNSCHPFYTGTQKFVDTAGRVDKYQQRAAKTAAAQAAASVKKKKA
jgi:large subunit ribosomal protein L31